jgi:hypothetical protein
MLERGPALGTLKTPPRLGEPWAAVVRVHCVAPAHTASVLQLWVH